MGSSRRALCVKSLWVTFARTRKSKVWWLFLDSPAAGGWQPWRRISVLHVLTAVLVLLATKCNSAFHSLHSPFEAFSCKSWQTNIFSVSMGGKDARAWKADAPIYTHQLSRLWLFWCGLLAALRAGSASRDALGTNQENLSSCFIQQFIEKCLQL